MLGEHVEQGVETGDEAGQAGLAVERLDAAVGDENDGRLDRIEMLLELGEAVGRRAEARAPGRKPCRRSSRGCG